MKRNFFVSSGNAFRFVSGWSKSLSDKKQKNAKSFSEAAEKCWQEINLAMKKFLNCRNSFLINLNVSSLLLQMAHLPRRRLNSLSDNSTPSSDISEGSETYEASGHEWQLDSQNSHSLIVDNLDLRLDSLSLDTNSIAEITDNERAQIESFFSGLGTEVSSKK